MDREQIAKMDTYWLIERGSPAEYWVGSPPEMWTKNHREALRFTEWGAKHHVTELERRGVKGPLRACEHMDLPAIVLAAKEPK